VKKQPDLLNEDYWSSRYQNNDTVWDMGKVSPPLKEYFEQLIDKSISILIPGCGNAYEAEYLLQKGFKNITLVDISPVLVNKLKKQFSVFLHKEINIICGDFFALNQTFDLIVEQTFFCAIDPSLRTEYANKMHSLLNINGKLAGVFFNRTFDDGPPFSGSYAEYNLLFEDKFEIRLMDECYNSINPRKGSELFLIMQKL
jgi:SAM-dependent methyltransferase